MVNDLGFFIDKGDESQQPRSIRNRLANGKIISRTDTRTDLEYFIDTGKLPHNQGGNCDVCKNKGNKEKCNLCSGYNPLFIVITIEEAKERLAQERKNVK